MAQNLVSLKARVWCTLNPWKGRREHSLQSCPITTTYTHNNNTAKKKETFKKKHYKKACYSGTEAGRSL